MKGKITATVFVLLLLTLDTEASLCKVRSTTFRGLCKKNINCASICAEEGNTGGFCSHLGLKCMCTKDCSGSSPGNNGGDPGSPGDGGGPSSPGDNGGSAGKGGSRGRNGSPSAGPSSPDDNGGSAGKGGSRGRNGPPSAEFAGMARRFSSYA